MRVKRQRLLNFGESDNPRSGLRIRIRPSDTYQSGRIITRSRFINRHTILLITRGYYAAAKYREKCRVTQLARLKSPCLDANAGGVWHPTPPVITPEITKSPVLFAIPVCLKLATCLTLRIWCSHNFTLLTVQ